MKQHGNRIQENVPIEVKYNKKINLIKIFLRSRWWSVLSNIKSHDFNLSVGFKINYLRYCSNSRRERSFTNPKNIQRLRFIISNNRIPNRFFNRKIFLKYFGINESLIAESKINMLDSNFLLQKGGPIIGRNFFVKWMWDGEDSHQNHRYAMVSSIDVEYFDSRESEQGGIHKKSNFVE